MSRIGKQPIQIPSDVSLEIKDARIVAKGPKGELTQRLVPSVDISLKDGSCEVARSSDQPKDKAMHGLYRQLIQNMVTGVVTGFSRVLLIQGVGYRVQLQGKNLQLSLGYSLPIEFEAPEGISFSVEGQNKIVVSGIDKQKVGQVAAEIRSIRPPEVYKGKGVRYENEHVRLKAGKAGIK